MQMKFQKNLKKIEKHWKMEKFLNFILMKINVTEN